MPVQAVREQIIKTLGDAHEALTMAALIERIRQDVPAMASAITIRAAVLPLITLQRVEFTTDRKLLLK